MSKIERRMNLLPWIVLLIAGLTYLFWAYAIPIYNAPDEQMRYQVPQFIFKYGKLPTGYDAVYHLGNWSYAFYPQFLGALISTLFMKVLVVFNDSEFALIYMARLASVFFGLVTVFFTGKIIGKVTRDKLLVSIGMVTVAFLPQFTFLSSYVNNDIIGASGASIIIYAMVSAYYDMWNKENSLILSLGFIVCGLGYLNSYGFMLVGGLYFIASNIINVKNKKTSWNIFAKNSFLVFIVTASVVFPFFIRNYVLYKDFFGMNVFHQEYERWLSAGGAILQIPYKGSIIDYFKDSTTLSTTYYSFVGMFGYMSIRMSKVFYNLYEMLFYIGAMGITVKTVKDIMVKYKGKRSTNINKIFLCMFIFLGVLITIVLHLYYSLEIDNQPQGRYIIANLVPIAIVITLGYKAILDWLFKRTMKIALSLTFIIAYIGVNFTIFVLYIVKGYENLQM